MSELLSKPLKTFSIGFNEADFNELEYSEKAANVYGTEHHIEIVKPDALALLPDLVKHYGEPFGDSSCLPTYYVCKLAKKHVTMVLSGDGGDECFAGYSTYADWMNELPINYRKGFKKIIYPTLEKLLPARYPKKDTLDTWLRIIEYNSGSWRYNLWREELRPTNINYPYEFEKLFDLTRSFSPCNKVQYMDARSYMTYDILNKVDVTSMMHSLEVRTPLIDKTLWEYASTIPEEFLIQRQDKKWNGKILLKQLLEKEFSNEFINRKKQGFAVPLSKWFSSNGELNSFVESKILNKNALLNNYFNPSGIAELTRNDNYGSIWLLLFLEEWLQQFKNFQKNEQKHYSIN